MIEVSVGEVIGVFKKDGFYHQGPFINQDEKFPEDKTVGLIKNFLQIKKWLKDLITKQLAGISTAKEIVSVK